MWGRARPQFFWTVPPFLKKNQKMAGRTESFFYTRVTLLAPRWSKGDIGAKDQGRSRRQRARVSPAPTNKRADGAMEKGRHRHRQMEQDRDGQQSQ
jgi:hypothetical protein